MLDENDFTNFHSILTIYDLMISGYFDPPPAGDEAGGGVAGELPDDGDDDDAAGIVEVAAGVGIVLAVEWT